MRRIYLIAELLAISLCLGIATTSYADGGFFPPSVYKKPAEVPAQRALISFREGRETLVIESSFSTEAKDVAWVIPLPEVPDKIQPVSPGAMKTISFCIQPSVTHVVSKWLLIISAFIIWTSLVIVSVHGRFFQFNFPKPPWVLLIVMLIVLVDFLAGWLLPVLSWARSEVSVIGATIEQQVQVGNYDVSILRAENAEGLNEWLKENGFMPVPPEGLPFVSEYVQEGWCFATAKLGRDEGGMSTPHPIRFDFPTDQAVYPMKLTSLAGTALQLELFVVGTQAASSKLLTREFSDSYKEVPQVEEYPPRSSYLPENGVSRYFKGVTFSQDIGHLDLMDVLWPDCTVTKLSGNLNSSQMKEDIYFSWSDLKPMRRHVFSYFGARLVAIVLSATIFSLTAFFAFLFFRKRILQPDGKWWYAWKILLPIAIGITCAGLIFYFVVPKVEVYLSPGRIYPLGMFSKDEYTFETPVETIAEDVEEAFASGFPPTRNEFTGGPVVRGEASPGNYDVRKEDGKLYFIYYDRSGAEQWQLLAVEKQ